MENVRYGVIGIGNMGTSHSGWLAGGKIPGATLTAVCDIDREEKSMGKGKPAGGGSFRGLQRTFRQQPGGCSDHRSSTLSASGDGDRVLKEKYQHHG